MFFISKLKHIFKFFIKTQLISLLFCVLLYIFGFFILPAASCETGFLTRSIVYGKPYLHSPSINLSRLQLFHEQLQIFLLNASKEQYYFNIYEYVSLDGCKYPRKHPYRHPNINLYVNHYVEHVLQIHLNIQASHQKYSNFIKFTNFDIFGKERNQYINNMMSLYDAEKVSPVLFGDQKFMLKYTEINFEKIVNYYKNV